MNDEILKIMIIILIAIIFIIVLFLLIAYNKIINLKNRVKQSKSGIDVYLNQRFDLIPNLVECVKAYSKYETELFENITQLRSQYNKNEKSNFEQAQELDAGINKILAIAENYPDLKASNQYLNLQNNLVRLESQLQAARRIYNNDVTNYNTTIQSVPINIIANMFKFEEEELFEIEEYKKENLKIDNQ